MRAGARTADVERVDAGLSFGVVGTPDYRAKNPNGLIPLLEDGDFTLWESNVIVRYLCCREGSPLYPQDLQQRFNAERWMDWQQTELNPAGSPAFKQWIRTPAEQRNLPLIAASVAATEPLFARLDEHLSRQAFMAGDSADDGRHPDRLRGAPLVGPAAAAPGLAAPRTLVRAVALQPARARFASVLK